MIDILLIGAGQIGSRHLQSLALLDVAAHIDVVDPSEKASAVAQARYDEISSIAAKPSIAFLDAVEKIKAHYDVVLITTDSLPRRKILENVVAHTELKYLILEKFLFPRLEDYAAVSQLLIQHGTKAFVNTARRLYEDYQEITPLFEASKNIRFQVSGSNWGLGCNGIHFLDLFAMMTRNTNVTLEMQEVDKELMPSKRANYAEFSGTLKGFDDQNNTLEITSHRDGSAPLIVEISADNRRVIVNESAREMSISTENNVQSKPFRVKYQSELTQVVVKDLVQRGTCQLTNYEDSSQLHQVFLTAFLKHYNQITGQQTDLCPIT